MSYTDRCLCCGKPGGPCNTPTPPAAEPSTEEILTWLLVKVPPLKDYPEAAEKFVPYVNELRRRFSELASGAAAMRQAILRVRGAAYLDDNVLNRHPSTTIECQAIKDLFAAIENESGRELLAELERLKAENERVNLDVRDMLAELERLRECGRELRRREAEDRRSTTCAERDALRLQMQRLEAAARRVISDARFVKALDGSKPKPWLDLEAALAGHAAEGTK